jgi:NADPH2:quinone reductase
VRAAWYEQTGPAADVLQVGELPDPHPGAGEVRVRVALSGVNPTDWRSRTRPDMPFPRVVPHQDGAGTIDAVGDGVDPARVGERVWIWDAAFGRPTGTAAEYTVVPAERAMRLPDDASFELGACLGIPARTAHRAVFADGVPESVLVTGGAGAVGFFAIQLAKRAGVTVFATVSSDEKAALARAAGADHVLNYRTDDVATAARGVERVVEVAPAANLQSSLGALRPNGTWMTYAVDEPEFSVPAQQLLLRNISLRWMLVYTMPPEASAAALAFIQNALSERAMRPLPVIRFALDDVVAAHEAVESNAVGKVMVEL